MKAEPALIKKRNKCAGQVSWRERDQTHFTFGNPGPKQADGLVLMGPGRQQSHSKSSSAGDQGLDQGR